MGFITMAGAGAVGALAGMATAPPPGSVSRSSPNMISVALGVDNAIATGVLGVALLMVGTPVAAMSGGWKTFGLALLHAGVGALGYSGGQIYGSGRSILG